jgi:hypothetical protein
LFVRAASPEPVASDRVAPSWYVGLWPQRRSSGNAYTLGTFSFVVETTATYAEMASTMAISVAVGFIANPDHVVVVVIRAKVVLELAKQLGNVSQACKMMGYSRLRRRR